MTNKVLNVCSNFYPYSFGGTEVYVEAYCNFLKENDKEPIVICAVPERAFTENQSVYEDRSLKVCTYKYNDITVFGLMLKSIDTELVYSKFDEKLESSYVQFLAAQTLLRKVSTLHIHSFTAAIGLNLFESIIMHNKGLKVVTSYHTPISCPKNTLMLGQTLNECQITPNVKSCTNCIAQTQNTISPLLAKIVQLFNLNKQVWPAIFRQKHLVNVGLKAFKQLKEITNEWWCYSEGIKNILLKNNIKQDNIKFSRHGIGALFLDPNIEKRTDITIYLFSGRLTRIKGIITLLKAWLQTPETGTKVLWITAQKEKTRNAEIDDLIQKTTKREDIQFLGNKSQNELSILYKKTHFVVIPSECFEIGPLVFHEAIANGCNVIASNIGGSKELAHFYKIENNLFEAGNVLSLKEKLMESAFRKYNNVTPKNLDEHFQILR